MSLIFTVRDNEDLCLRNKLNKLSPRFKYTQTIEKPVRELNPYKCITQLYEHYASYL